MLGHMIDPDVVLEYLTACPPDTKLYLGADSERFRVKGQWYRDITTVLVVHLGGRHGCKIFGEITREPDYEKNKSRPIMRMMAEVYSVAELFHRLKDVIDASEFDVEVHIDINPDLKAGSSCAIDQAIGYIKGVTGITPIAKPDAFSASYAADRFKEIQSFKTVEGFQKLSYRKKKRINEAA